MRAHARCLAAAASTASTASAASAPRQPCPCPSKARLTAPTCTRALLCAPWRPCRPRSCLPSGHQSAGVPAGLRVSRGGQHSRAPPESGERPRAKRQGRCLPMRASQRVPLRAAAIARVPLRAAARCFVTAESCERWAQACSHSGQPPLQAHRSRAVSRWACAPLSALGTVLAKSDSLHPAPLALLMLCSYPPALAGLFSRAALGCVLAGCPNPCAD
jgi:hypothetical protein